MEVSETNMEISLGICLFKIAIKQESHTLLEMGFHCRSFKLLMWIMLSKIVEKFLKLRVYRT